MAEEHAQAPADEGEKVPFFVWPWKLCTEDDKSAYWKGALMCIGMFGTAAGVKMCELYAEWCIGSATVALLCSFLAQREIFLTGNLKKIHHGLEYKNKSIIEETDILKFSMNKNKEQVEDMFSIEKDLGVQLRKLENVAGKQLNSRRTFNENVEKLRVQREKIKTSFVDIQKTMKQMYGSDDKLADDLENFSAHIEDLTDCESEMREDLNKLKETYNKLNDAKQNMHKELKAFQKMKQIVEDAGIKWTKDIIGMTESMKFKYKDLFQLCMTFSTNFLREIVHNVEYMDGKPGWTWEKFQELLRRLPNNVRAKADFRAIREVFRKELMKAASHKQAKLLGSYAVSFDVFQKEIVEKLLLPLCDVFSSGADNIEVEDDVDESDMKGLPTSAEVEL